MKKILNVLPLELGAFVAAGLTIVSNFLLLFFNVKLFGYGMKGNFFYCIANIFVGLMMISGIREVSFDALKLREN